MYLCGTKCTQGLSICVLKSLQVISLTVQALYILASSITLLRLRRAAYSAFTDLVNGAITQYFGSFEWNIFEQPVR